MVRFLADEDFNGRILQILGGLAKFFEVEIDVVRVQDAGLMGSSDPVLLEWAASNQRTLLTHDRKSMIMYARVRVVNGLPMPGVFMIQQGRQPNEAAYAILNEVTLRVQENRGWESQVVWP